MAKKQNELVCSFCGRHESEVELMMPGYTANICNDCAEHAAQLAKEIFDSLANCSVMLVGAGKMAELTAMHMASQGVEKLYVANRHLAKAESLAERGRADCCK